jgi:hypothetical protein
MATATGKVPMSTTPWGASQIDRPLDNAALTYYPGAMMALNSAGSAVKALDSPGLTFAGINIETDRVVVLSGTAVGDYTVRIDRPWRFQMAVNFTAALGMEGTELYLVDDQTLGTSSNNSILVGWIDQVISPSLVSVEPLYAPLNPVAVSGNVLAFNGASTVDQITFPGNLADALNFKVGGASYLKFTTTTGSEVSLLQGPAATGTTSVGGSAQILGGIGGATSGAGGTATMTGGAGTNGNAAGGACLITGGLGQGSAAGGAIAMVSGAAGATGVAGAITLTVGAATAGAGSAVTITAGAGAGSTNAGGNVNLVGGAAVSTGIPGEVQVNGNSGLIPIQVALSATDASRAVFIATRACRLKAVKMMLTVGSTSGTLTVEKLTGTTAAGSGTVLLGGTIDLSTNTAANTSTSGTLISTVASLTLAAGDRLGVVIAGTMTSLAGCIVTMMIAPA